jgi:hypothetical protein
VGGHQDLVMLQVSAQVLPIAAAKASREHVLHPTGQHVRGMLMRRQTGGEGGKAGWVILKVGRPRKQGCETKWPGAGQECLDSRPQVRVTQETSRITSAATP